MNVLVLVAMETERSAILSRFPLVKVRHRLPLGLAAHRIARGSSNVYLAGAGVGTANAAAATAVLAEKLSLDAVLLLGVGGSLSSSLEIGDTVVASRILQHDCRLTLDGGRSEFMAPGELHLSLSPELRPSPFIPVDPIWRDWLTRAAGGRAVAGLLLSGNEFVGSASRKAELAKLAPDALLVDMEAAGVAQIARKLGLPFGAAKTVSDRLSPGVSVTADYATFLAKAAENSSRIFARLLADPPPRSI
jgi:nucleoside phosphorylase